MFSQSRCANNCIGLMVANRRTGMRYRNCVNFMRRNSDGLVSEESRPESSSGRPYVVHLTVGTISLKSREILQLSDTLRVSSYWDYNRRIN